MTHRERLFTTSRPGHDILTVALDGLVWIECVRHDWAQNLGSDPTFGEIEDALRLHLNPSSG